MLVIVNAIEYGQVLKRVLIYDHLENFTLIDGLKMNVKEVK